MKFNLAVYLEAIEELRKAADAVDQADAMLRGIGCRDYAEVKVGIRWFPIRDIGATLASAVKTLETVACEDCGGLISQHGETCAAKEGK